MAMRLIRFYKAGDKINLWY